MRDETAGKGRQVGDQRTLRLTTEDDMELLNGDGDADPREHAVHDSGGEGEREPPDPGDSEQNLDHTGSAGDAGRGGPPELADEARDDNGQARGGAADLKG
ncbi:hypothetical protein GCM10009745_39840 [Kribbella yunnanensis]|uniref:Uncharacterized protein n=1 Tax=Kribbella yunnanensis TaxID=190194 RepID=A0ABN2HN81_9ACTN